MPIPGTTRHSDGANIKTVGEIDMERITRNMVQIRLDILKAIVGKTADDWELDYYSIGGGYKVIDGKTGHSPIHSSRRKANEMYDMLSACADLAYLMTREAE
jgi:hypothetical protein